MPRSALISIWLPRLGRLAVVLAGAALIRTQAGWMEAQRSARISLAQARDFFPEANRVFLRDPAQGLHYAVDPRGRPIGMLLTTAPETDAIIGYSGPNNLLVALDTNGIVAGVRLLHSGDTPEHVRKVTRDPKFLPGLAAWNPAGSTPPAAQAVSGATLTSHAIVEAVQRRLTGAAPSMRFPEPVSLAELQQFWTNAARFEVEGRRFRVLDERGRLIGWAARTSPEGDNAAGYRGPTESLVALAPDGRTILDLRLRHSYDTPSYVEQIARHSELLTTYRGRSIEEMAAFDVQREKIAGISGATATAQGVAGALKRRFAQDVQRSAAAPAWKPRARDLSLACVGTGAVVMAFSALRGRRWARWTWQALLIGFVGLWCGDFLSLAVLGGWAAHGVPWQAASGLVLLALAALLVPWATRRQLYCHHVCPHGAAQQWLGVLGRHLVQRRRTAANNPEGESRVSASQVVQALRETRRAPSSRSGGAHPRPSQPLLLRRWLRVAGRFPHALLVTAFICLLAGVPVNLAVLEPFDAWLWKTAGMVTVLVAAGGLLLSVFVPQAYCRFGCPTGALLNFLRARGSADRWSGRDTAAVVCVLAGALAAWAARSVPRHETDPEPVAFEGRAMGTTWSVKLREEIGDRAALERLIAGQFEWCEQMTSNWRTNTDISAFNRSRSTDPMPVVWPLVTLGRWSAEISRDSGGAFDITVGPAVRLWGFGPGSRRDSPPPDAAVESLRGALGWQRIEVLDGQLRKTHPETEIDLSAIAKGWAIDEVARLLERRGFSDFLVEAGGELRANGIWKIAIEHPPRALTLTNASLATSGTYRQRFASGGGEYSHLIDPRTARPVSHRTVAVSVRHADCARADAWATALNVMGADDGWPVAERLGLAAEFVVEQPGGRLELRQTSRWGASAH